MSLKQNIVITGANTGIGLATAKSLYADGHNIIFGSRNQQKNANAVTQITKSSPNSKGTIKCFKLDLAIRSSIEQFATSVNKQFDHIDILINNAGLIVHERQISELGIEMTMTINHFGHFLLTYLLFPNIKKSKQARIINLSSAAQDMYSDSTVDDLTAQKSYSSFNIYSKSKLANVQFTVGLAQRLAKNHPNIKAVSVHPGVVDSDFNATTPCCSFLGIFKCLCCCCFVNTDTGARSSLYLSKQSFANIRSGQFYDSDTTIGKMNPLGRNKEHVDRLWNESQKIYKIEFII